MKVWIYAKLINGQYPYIHIFTGNKTHSGKVFIDKSLIKYGDIGSYFTKPGGMMTTSSVNEEEYSDVKKGLIRWIFDGSIKIGDGLNFEVEE